MNRLFFGFAAILFAAALASFTTPKSTPKDLTEYYFEFPANISAAESDVEDETKWVPANDMNGCSEGEARACKIRVTLDHVEGGALKTSANIQASELSGVAFVTGGNLEEYINRANP